MAESLDPNVQGIIDALPVALQELQTAQTDLSASKIALRDVSREQEGLDEERAAALAGVETDQVQAIMDSYSPRLQRVMGFVFGEEEGHMTQMPPLEQVQQVAELDNCIVRAAGQPIVVLKPGKTWVDIGMLQKPEEMKDATGLQRSYGSRHKTSSIVLPVHNGVIIDIRTGTEPDNRDDTELQAINRLTIDMQREQTRPIIDPLKTRVLLSSEDGQAIAADPETTYVLVGYTQVLQVLNRILRFNYDDDPFKAYSVIKAQQRLEQEAGVSIDPDFIDGFLAGRIGHLEQEMKDGGPLAVTSSAYQQTVLDGLKQKHAALIAAGWIS